MTSRSGTHSQLITKAARGSHKSTREKKVGKGEEERRFPRVRKVQCDERKGKKVEKKTRTREGKTRQAERPREASSTRGGVTRSCEMVSRARLPLDEIESRKKGCSVAAFSCVNRS